MYNGGSDGKETAYNARDLGSIPGSGRFPREGNGNPLQYSCLENSMDRGAWWAIVPGIVESDATEQLLHTYTHTHTHTHTLMLPTFQSRYYTFPSTRKVLCS